MKLSISSRSHDPMFFQDRTALKSELSQRKLKMQKAIRHHIIEKEQHAMNKNLMEIRLDENGYGKICRQVMCDRNLPLTAKALYAYFCSYAGGGSTEIPTRDKIMRDLHLAKNTYTKYLNSLLEKKYLKRYRTSTGNLFEIPPVVPDQEGNMVELKAKGYGTIPKFAMQDDRLTAAAKGIYAYFCSHANTAFPKRDTILYELGICSQKYYQHYKLLVDLGYITPIRENNVNGRFSSSSYILNTTILLNPLISSDKIRKSASLSHNRDEKEPQINSMTNQMSKSKEGKKKFINSNMKNYIAMSTHHLQNKDLSLEAKGLLSQMLSLSEDWDHTMKGLILINRESIDTIQTVVRELEKAEYITCQQIKDDKGEITDTVYTINEQPQHEPKEAEPER